MQAIDNSIELTILFHFLVSIRHIFHQIPLCLLPNVTEIYEEFSHRQSAFETKSFLVDIFRGRASELVLRLVVVAVLLKRGSIFRRVVCLSVCAVVAAVFE